MYFVPESPLSRSFLPVRYANVILKFRRVAVCLTLENYKLSDYQTSHQRLQVSFFFFDIISQIQLTGVQCYDYKSSIRKVEAEHYVTLKRKSRLPMVVKYSTLEIKCQRTFLKSHVEMNTISSKDFMPHGSGFWILFKDEFAFSSAIE